MSCDPRVGASRLARAGRVRHLISVVVDLTAPALADWRDARVTWRSAPLYALAVLAGVVLVVGMVCLAAL